MKKIRKHLVGHSYLLALYELVANIDVKLAVKHIADVEKHNNLLSVDIVIIPYRQEVVKRYFNCRQAVCFVALLASHARNSSEAVAPAGNVIILYFWSHALLENV